MEDAAANRVVVDNRRRVGGSLGRAAGNFLLTNLVTLGEQGITNALVKVQQDKHANANSGKRREKNGNIGSFSFVEIFWISEDVQTHLKTGLDEKESGILFCVRARPPIAICIAVCDDC